jgi:hypothetical protein
MIILCFKLFINAFVFVKKIENYPKRRLGM